MVCNLINSIFNRIVAHCQLPGFDILLQFIRCCHWEEVRWKAHEARFLPVCDSNMVMQKNILILRIYILKNIEVNVPISERKIEKSN